MLSFPFLLFSHVYSTYVCVFFSPISSALPHFPPLASNEPERRLIIVITAVIVVSLSLSYLLFPDCDGDVTHWAERKEDIQGKKRDTNDTLTEDSPMIFVT